MNEDSDDATPAEPTPEAPSEPSALETFMRPIVEEEALRPVVAAVVIGLGSVLGWGLLLAVRDRRPGAIIAIVLLGIITSESLIRARRSNGRFGVAGWSVIVLWLASTIFAIGGHWTGYL